MITFFSFWIIFFSLLIFLKIATAFNGSLVFNRKWFTKRSNNNNNRQDVSTTQQTHQRTKRWSFQFQLKTNSLHNEMNMTTKYADISMQITCSFWSFPLGKLYERRLVAIIDNLYTHKCDMPASERERERFDHVLLPVFIEPFLYLMYALKSRGCSH